VSSGDARLCLPPAIGSQGRRFHHGLDFSSAEIIQTGKAEVFSTVTLTKEGHMKVTAVFCMLFLLIGGAAFVSTNAEAAAWISGSDSYAAPWVKDIEQELMKKEYRYVFGNDPRTPQASVLRLLNRAALAYQADDTAQAEQLVHDALDVLDDGVRRHYFSQSDIAPIVDFIRRHTPVKTS
jgi:hypothetical protein